MIDDPEFELVKEHLAKKAYQVIQRKSDGVYFRRNGYHHELDGTFFEQDWYEVKPVKKTVITF